jgi:hypothetical protein
MQQVALLAPLRISGMHTALPTLLLTPSLGQNSPLTSGITIFLLALRKLKRSSYPSESRLEGVNRQNLKFTNIKHTLCSGLALELNQSAKDSSPCLEFLNQCGKLLGANSN